MSQNIPLERQIFCNRTLNLRSIQAIGYDMDYTLIHYRVEEWEKQAYEYIKEQFLALNWPVEHLAFDPELVCRGIMIDRDLGNLVKANRFGFIKHAYHGTRPLDFDTQRKNYSRLVAQLSEERWVFLNTLFSLSEACLYAQLVDLLDQNQIPEVLGYNDLYERVRDAASAAHMEGRLKQEIISNPEPYVIQDPETPLTLLDQQKAGKKTMLITNSEWHYTQAMMEYSFDPCLPKGMSWKDLFDLVIVSAGKPGFFTADYPFFEVVTNDGLLSPNVSNLEPGKFYFGGSARQLEKNLNLAGDQILYVGDHMFGDVRVTKGALRWRTALILRELEEEIEATESFREQEQQLAALMDEKSLLEEKYCQTRLQLQRKHGNYGEVPSTPEEQLQKQLAEYRRQLEEYDQQISPLAKAATQLNNPTWGLLMRTGNDKSHLAFQIERYADVYTSRVSNFLLATPFIYLRSMRGSLPHDPSLPGGRPHSPLSQ